MQTMKTIELTEIEAELKKKIALDPQAFKQLVNNHHWKIKGLKDYLLSLEN